MGRLVETLNALGQKTSFTYDRLNRVVSVLDSLEGESKQAYDEAGNFSSLTDPNGNISSYTYDPTGKLIEETTAIGSVKQYGYNALNLLSSSTNGRGQETTYHYDEAGRLVSFSDPVGTVAYSYDPNGNVLTTSDSSGTIKRQYDALNRVTQYTDSQGNTIHYTYDAVGNLTTLTYPDGKIVNYEYDAANRLNKVSDWSDRVTTYGYDRNGRLTTTTRANGTILTNHYDVAGRLLEQKDVDAKGAVINQYEYTYDAEGKITVEKSARESGTFEMKSAVMEYDTGNRLISYNGETVEYDEDGNMTYGPLGGKMVQYRYDSRNRLIQAGNTTYLYDAENNRIAIIENGVRIDYVINPLAALSQVLMEKDAAGKTTYYLYGEGLIGEEDNGTYRTYHFDNRGSTTALTDMKGQVTDRFNYGPYGELVNRTGTTKTPFLYKGRDGVMTDSNGLYYLRARYYNPEIKRFINQDVLQGSILDGRSLNRYAYVNGNPVSLTDPFGLSPSFKPLSILHGFLDIISMIDPSGIVDAVNAVIYLAEGDFVAAGISGAAIFVPAFFDAGMKVAKWGSASFKATRVSQKFAAGYARSVDYTRAISKNIANRTKVIRETWNTSSVSRILADQRGSVSLSRSGGGAGGRASQIGSKVSEGSGIASKPGGYLTHDVDEHGLLSHK